MRGRISTDILSADPNQPSQCRTNGGGGGGVLEEIRGNGGFPSIDVKLVNSRGVLFDEEEPFTAGQRLDDKLPPDERSIGSIRADDSDIDFDAE